jgi:hypothetical protein
LRVDARYVAVLVRFHSSQSADNWEKVKLSAELWDAETFKEMARSKTHVRHTLSFTAVNKLSLAVVFSS